MGEVAECDRVDPQPKRIQRRRVKGWRAPPGTVHASRPSLFGNPFSSRLPRAEQLRLYRLFVRRRWPELNKAGVGVGGMMMLHVLHRQMREHLHLIRAARFVSCYCKLEDACHVDILIAWALREEPKT